MRRFLLATIALAVAASAPVHAQSGAPTCERFQTAITDAMPEYDAPAPVFQQDDVSQYDANVAHWSITTFDDVRVSMICAHGTVESFMVVPDTNEISNIHFAIMMEVGLRGYGLAPKTALSLRDDLIREAKAKGPKHVRIAETHIDGSNRALFIISVDDAPSFEIETKH
jgi:hypothetical protein